MDSVGNKQTAASSASRGVRYIGAQDDNPTDTTSEPKFKTSFNYFILLNVLIVDLLATSGDIAMTWASPMFSKLHSNDSSINPLSKPITENEDALIASLIHFGAMLGGFPFSYVAEHFGRKTALQGIGFSHIVAYTSMAFAKDVRLFYFGRVLGGLATGGSYTLLPMYIAEISEESRRGLYSVTLGIFWALGNFLSYLLGPFLSVMIFNLVNCCFPSVFLITFSLLGVETPYYLIGASKMKKAEHVLMQLRDKDSKDVQTELQYIKDSLDKEEDNSSGNFTAIFTHRGIRKAFIISITLIALVQLTGWNAITSYLQPIFEASGSKLSPEIDSMIVGAAIFGCSLPSPYLAHKFDRKTLLIGSALIVALCLLLVGVYFSIDRRTNMSTGSIAWLPVTSLVVFTLSFQTGFSAIPWTVSAEIFPKNIKRLSSSTTSASCSMTSFLITHLFNQMTVALGVDGTFYIFAGFSVLVIIFTLLYVPETRGKTFVEIQDLLLK